jgi:hypothetical protein
LRLPHRDRAKVDGNAFKVRYRLAQFHQRVGLMLQRPANSNMSATKSPSVASIANVNVNDAMILPHDANPRRIRFSERRGIHTNTTNQQIKPC